MISIKTLLARVLLIFLLSPTVILAIAWIAAMFTIPEQARELIPLTPSRWEQLTLAGFDCSRMGPMSNLEALGEFVCHIAQVVAVLIGLYVLVSLGKRKKNGVDSSSALLICALWITVSLPIGTCQ